MEPVARVAVRLHRGLERGAEIVRRDDVAVAGIEPEIDVLAVPGDAEPRLVVPLRLLPVARPRDTRGPGDATVHRSHEGGAGCERVEPHRVDPAGRGDDDLRVVLRLAGGRQELLHPGGAAV